VRDGSEKKVDGAGNGAVNTNLRGMLVVNGDLRRVGVRERRSVVVWVGDER